MENYYDGPAKEQQMFEYLLERDCIICSNNRLYLYNEEEGRYVLLPANNEWLAISEMFSDDLCAAIQPSVVRGLMQRLKQYPEIHIDYDKLNFEEYFINIKNGVYNYKTDEFYKRSKSFYFTYQLNVNLIDDVDINEAETFVKFYKTSLDRDVDKYALLMQIIGYLCTRSMKAKKCFILHGAPNSGKSLILHLIEEIIGKEFISNIPFERLGDKFSSAILSTKALNISAELSANALRNIEAFKMIVGGDRMAGEYKGQTMFEFDNKCKLLCAGNVLPPIKNEDISNAFANRIVLLNFPHSIEEKDIDYEMKEKLCEEKDIIFTVAMSYLFDLVKSNYKFTEPEDSKNILKDYVFRQRSIDEFINECCEYDSEARVSSKVLYEHYEEFCKNNVVKPISHQMFSQKVHSMKGVNLKKIRDERGESVRGVIGIRLLKNKQDSEK